ncbi:MAG: hypothetical protein LBV57_05800 [Candidatus Symbiothrix sp.]|jgi:hypothetical protein|nr:hypothetical protein [Candidatus Symbiothrix sp.]
MVNKDWLASNKTALTNSAFDTKTPYHFSFDGDSKGKTLYIALRWENTTGQKQRS